MLMAYSAGLHHVQVPGQKLPRLFKTLTMRLEEINIPTYRDALGGDSDPQEFKARVRTDLEQRRDLYCQVESVG